MHARARVTVVVLCVCVCYTGLQRSCNVSQQSAMRMRYCGGTGFPCSSALKFKTLLKRGLLLPETSPKAGNCSN